MKIKSLIKWLEKQDQELDLYIIMPDCGGYDAEVTKLETPNLFLVTDYEGNTGNVAVIANSNLPEIWSDIEKI